ncbi:hypothetical protein B6P79_003833 [Escherichia coli]|nr:hypothetical protein [Escherichia coli]EIH4817249.1 hypothetical protein [Escherichia coli]
MLMASDNAYAEEDLILSDFIGKRERWTQKREELYASLVRKGVNIETAKSGDMTVVSVGLHGVSVSAANHEPYVALSESMVRLIKFLKYTEANNVIIGKKNIPFSSAFYWIMKGLDARRASWPKGSYISMFRGCVDSKEKLVDFLPEEVFDIVEGCDVMVMPRLVMMDGDLQARSDWFAAGVDIIATDWEVF